MKKIFLTLTLLAAIVFSFPTFAMADLEDAAQLPHITDAANILSESETETLETLAVQTTKAHSCSVYIIIVDDYGNYTDDDIEDCAETLYNYYQLGWGEERNGILLMMSMYDRDYDICAFGSLAHASFTDYGKGELADMFLDNFRKDDWYGGFADFIRGCDELLKMQEAGEPLDVNSYGDEEELSPVVKIVMAVAIPCVVALIVCLIFLRQMKSAHPKTEADDYAVPNSLRLRVREDIFTHRTEVREVIETNRSGGGGTSINSGGFSHSSGKF